MLKTKVVGYVRVSTEEQSSEGVSLAAQRAKLEQYAALHDLDLIAVECDAGVSAKSLDRPALLVALGRLTAGEAAGLLIAKLDRLSRSVTDWNRLIREFFNETAGKELFSVADSIDTRTAAGRMVINIVMSIAQWEREAIGERTRDALAYKRANGQLAGTVPFGKRLDDDGVTLADDPAERAALDHIRDKRREGWSLRKIADDLTTRGVSTKGGGPWKHSTIAGILKRPNHHQNQRDFT